MVDERAHRLKFETLTANPVACSMPALRSLLDGVSGYPGRMRQPADGRRRRMFARPAQ
jgi:hypothetical protein